MVSLTGGQQGHTLVAAFNVIGGNMRDKNKQIVPVERVVLFLWPHVEEVPFGGIC